MKRMLWVVAVFALVIGAATEARAQSMRAFKGYFTGHVGAISGGEVSSAALTPGLSVSVQESDGWGAELDFGYSADVDSGLQELDIATYMVNLNWIYPVGQLRPYGAGGVGLLQIDGCNVPCNREAKTNDVGWNVGGGLLFALNETLGVRGDVRYLWTTKDHADLQRPDNFGFWRASIGVTFMWAILP